jgi:hypothetical protein
MMTSGIIVQFDPDSPGSIASLDVIRSTPAFAIGEQRSGGLSAALEARDAAESEHWLDWLRGLPGVTGVEVVFVHWDATEVTGA